jgi:hypothetical protein
VLQELQLAVGTLGQDRCAERLHDLLDSNGLVCELILCRTEDSLDAGLLATLTSAHQTRPNAPWDMVSIHTRSQGLSRLTIPTGASSV